MAAEPIDAAGLMRMTRAELDELFKASPPGEIPDGEAKGTAIIRPGTLLTRALAAVVRWLCWQGKVFDARSGSLVNRISVFGVKAIKAQVYKGPSWLDQKECIVLDYSKTSRVARKVRDEIRQVAPGLYLGKVYWGRKRLIDFSVAFGRAGARSPLSASRTALILFLISLLYFAVRFNRNSPVVHAGIEDHFKYGSTGGEIEAGIPYAIWKALPGLFREHLPDRRRHPARAYEAFGFIYEDGRDLPIGVSRRNVRGLDRVFLNCAVCHAGTVRGSRGERPRIHLGMPANTVDLQAFQEFLFRCAEDR
ncbi:MAG: hypothetical protein ACRD2T_16610, partial [Thermoanaerobaculia bacterium]